MSDEGQRFKPSRGAKVLVPVVLVILAVGLLAVLVLVGAALLGGS
jgi:hypothetical protein